MTDMELNELIHVEVEGWEMTPPTFTWKWGREGRYQNDVPDYGNDPAWAVAMMEKHDLFRGSDPYTQESLIWWNTRDSEPIAADKSLTRAVALAVLALTREGK